MFLLTLFAVFVVCHADIAVTPPSAPRVWCGQTPQNIYKCLGNPKIFSNAPSECDKSISECERMKCIFRSHGWIENDTVKTAKVVAHFDQFGKDHPAWAGAVQSIKTECLTGTLPALGVYVNCPAYDIIHCALTRFIRKAQPSQWSAAPECAVPRQYAGACAVCPEDCYAPAIPTGSCNACRLLPTP